MVLYDDDDDEFQVECPACSWSGYGDELAPAGHCPECGTSMIVNSGGER